MRESVIVRIVPSAVTRYTDQQNGICVSTCQLGAGHPPAERTDFMLFRMIGLLLLLSLVGVAVVKREKIGQNLQLFWATQQIEQAQSSGDLLEATEELRAARKQFPDHTPFTLMLGEIYQHQNQPEAAQREYQSALKDDPAQQTVRLAYGRLLLKQALLAQSNAPGLATDHLNQAMVQFWEGVKLSPGDPQLLGSLGQIFQTAAENPRENRAAIRRWLDRWASYYYRLALKLPPLKDNPDLSLGLNFNMGVVAQRLNQPDLAVKHFCDALVLAPDRYDTHFNLGLSLVTLGMNELGYRHLNASVATLASQKPDDIEQARRLAEKVQQIKNEHYNSQMPGNKASPAAAASDSNTLPPWMKPACAVVASP